MCLFLRAFLFIYSWCAFCFYFFAPGHYWWPWTTTLPLWGAPWGVVQVLWGARLRCALRVLRASPPSASWPGKSCFLGSAGETWAMFPLRGNGRLGAEVTQRKPIRVATIKPRRLRNDSHRSQLAINGLDEKSSGIFCIHAYTWACDAPGQDLATRRVSAVGSAEDRGLSAATVQGSPERDDEQGKTWRTCLCFP